MEVLTPYPSPNYGDNTLLSKELANGSFFKALAGDVLAGRKPMRRYTDMSEIDLLIEYAGKEIRLDAISKDMHIFDIAKLKEVAWLPYYVKEESSKLEVVYDPSKYYRSYRYKNDTVKIGTYSGTSYDGVRIDTPYYEPERAGLAGFKKNGNGDVTEVWYYSLTDGSIRKLGDIPQDLVGKYTEILPYVKGIVLVRCTIDYDTNDYVYLGYTIDGGYNRIEGMGGGYCAFGDYGELAIETKDGANTIVYDSAMTSIQMISGNFVKAYTDSAINYTSMPFGIKVGSSLYYVRDENSSYKWKRRRDGWVVSIKNKPVWKYNKMHLYDYSTDGFLNTPLKFYHYNFRMHGVIEPPVAYPDKDVAVEYRYENADNYGDFVIAKYQDGSKKLFHTFDFKRWNECQTIAGGFLVKGRLWIQGRNDDLVGIIPRDIAIVCDSGEIHYHLNGYELRR